ncbi:MAG: OmpH family outer membrane protein [Nitrospirota bacterium]
MVGRRIRASGARGLMIGLAAVSMAVPAWAQSAEGPKFGYIDTQKVFDQSKVGKKAKGLLEEFVKSRQKIIDLEETEIKELEDSLVKQESVLSPEAKKAKQEDLQRKLIAYQKKATDLNREIQDKKAEVLNDFHLQLQGVVKKVAERDGYTMVFDKGAGGPADLAAVLYAKESLSITDKVLAELDKEVK